MISKEDLILSRFKYATRPHEAPMNTVQLNALYGKPKPKVSPLNIKQINRDFVDEYYMCNAMHKRYEW